MFPTSADGKALESVHGSTGAEAEPGAADGAVRPDLAPFADGTLLKPRPGEFFHPRNLFSFFQKFTPAANFFARNLARLSPKP